MELVNLKHSTKDILVPSPKVVKNMMIYTTESFFRNLGWKVFFFFNPVDKEQKKTYDFKSLKIPPWLAELEPFKNSMIELIKNMQFEKKPNKFQNQLQAEKKLIENEKKRIIAADKTMKYLQKIIRN